MGHINFSMIDNSGTTFGKCDGAHIVRWTNQTKFQKYCISMWIMITIYISTMWIKKGHWIITLYYENAKTNICKNGPFVFLKIKFENELSRQTSDFRGHILADISTLSLVILSRSSSTARARFIPAPLKVFTSLFKKLIKIKWLPKINNFICWKCNGKVGIACTLHPSRMSIPIWPWWMTKILKGLDNGLVTGMILIDLQKAFDTINHDILLKKLSIVNKWIRQF